MDLISLIIIISIIVKIVKKNKAAEENKQNTRTTQTTYRQRNSGQNSQWQQAARENIEKARRRAEEKLATYDMPKQNIRTTPAREQVTMQRQPAQSQRQPMDENDAARRQVHAARMEAKNTTILQRAKANTNEDRVDVTLQTMEAEHNHSERVAPAAHHHPEDIIPDNMLGNIEDLIVKGYDGNLCFERDFVGEAMDMISRFTVPTDVPDFSNKEAS